MGEFMGRMAGYMTGGALCFGVWLGDELGLYRALAGGRQDRRRPGRRRPDASRGWYGSGRTAKPPAG